MPAKDLGTKWTCFKCSTRFYDLKKPDPVCPRCGTDQRESPALRPPSETRRSRLSSVPRAPVVPEPVAEESDLLGEDDEESDEDADTGGDDDDV